MKLWKRILIIFGIFLVTLLGAGMLWSARLGRDAEPIVEDYLESSTQVTVIQDRWISFMPNGQSPSVGFIFYPGGNVDHRAYAPPLYDIATQGFLVIDVSMPFDLAVLDPDKAQDVIETFPEISTWVIGGHSLGGAMAARFVRTYPDQVDGLVLWAAYPAESDSLSGADVSVISITGTQDGLAHPGKIERFASLLPGNTIWFPIEGGNHAQFGFYGPQNRDRPAQISREEQQTQIVTATVDFLRSLDP
jgi:dienelactone hydrolase